ncbi:MAG: hypothetical protein JXN60_05730, partial [Lentisphaerae bacterium]|nr:hypothetical protein [Lentisphaerota bacterium]
MADRGGAVTLTRTTLLRFVSSYVMAVCTMFYAVVCTGANFEWVDITSQVTSNSYYIEYHYDSGTVSFDDYNKIAKFYECIAKCDSDTPDVSTNFTYDFSWSGAYIGNFCNWHAYKYVDQIYLEVDLRNFTTSNCVRVYLDWKVEKWKYGYKGGDYDKYYEYMLSRVDYQMELPLGRVTSIGPEFLIPEWPSYEPLNYEQSTEIYYVHTGPRILAELQITDCQPSTNRADEKAEIADPVNAIDGNVTRSVTDIAIPCPGLPLVFSRSYASTFDYYGPLGHRWTHSYNWRITETNTFWEGTTNTWKVVQTGDGKDFKFLVTTSGVYNSPYDNSWRLVATNAGYTLGTGHGISYLFNSNGVLETISDEWGNIVSLAYAGTFPTNQLTNIAHNCGQHLEINYAGDFISRVDSPVSNFYVLFSYNGADELTNTTRYSSSGIASSSYQYDTSGNHSLTQRVNAAGESAAWEYATNAVGATTSRGISAVVGENYYAASFNYPTNSLHQTTVTHERSDTNQVYEYCYHPITKRLEGIRGPNTVATNWSGTGRDIWYNMDDEGNVTNELVYDYAVNDWLSTVREYDDCHNITSEAFARGTDPSNEWSYAWDTNYNVMTLITDPEGHKLGFDYVKGLVSKAKLFSSATDSYDTVYVYTTNGLLASVTNANGHWVKYNYNSYGYCTSVVPQLGPTVAYDYSLLG